MSAARLTSGRARRLWSAAAWTCAGLWLAVQLPVLVGRAARQPAAFDFVSYRRAAEALLEGRSPYASSEQAAATWRSMHDDEVALRAAHAAGRGPQELRAQHARPVRPGPYVYPPTLARLIAWLRVTVPFFSVASALSILGFVGLWLWSARASAGWLFLVILSWDVVASLYGGNVELVLLFVTLLAAWLLWSGRPWLAAPPIALAVLVKPFYAAFFVAFAALAWSGRGGERARTPRVLARAAAGTAALIVLEVTLWGAPLRREAFGYLRRSLDLLWFALPRAEQTPLSIWNRTPMQVLVTAGVEPATAQTLSLAIWAALAAITLLWLGRRRLTFPLSFAAAFALLYLGRPIGWTLVYFEVVIAVAVWPALATWARAVLLTLLVSLMLSHWAAAFITASGAGMPFLTLQRPELPWETLLVLPAGWLLVLHAAVARRVRDPLTTDRTIESLE